ncbi:MAG TPA: hypothetical protein VK574_16470 [Terracidiphilus sp.]|nr:hypothetical protein [Terracidiphilus sp.]
MNRDDEHVKPAGEMERLETLEPELREALGNFKASVDAWSDAMMSRPREAKAPAKTNWSAITKWALGCVVFAGTVSGGLYQNHQQQEAAKVESARIAEQQQRAMDAAKLAKTDEEDLMAKVDSDIAREVPSALEPMASLMTEDDTQGN